MPIVNADWPQPGGNPAKAMTHVNLGATPVRHDLPPPMLGQHTDDVLGDVLQLDPARIAALRQAKVI